MPGKTGTVWWWEAFDSELAKGEDSLPGGADVDLFAWEPPWESDDLDDRPEWQRQLGERRCKRCGDHGVLDSLRHCVDCRAALGRCSWCGVDAVAHPQLRACGACQRWLARNVATVGWRAAHQRLISNGAARQSQRRLQRRGKL